MQALFRIFHTDFTLIAGSRQANVRKMILLPPMPTTYAVAPVCKLRCNSLRGALYRRAPLSEKRSTGSFYRIHPCGALDVGDFRSLRRATKGRRPLETCELLKKLDQNFYFGFAVLSLCCRHCLPALSFLPFPGEFPATFKKTFIKGDLQLSAEMCIIKVTATRQERSVFLWKQF